MKHASTSVKLAICLAMLSAAPAFSRTADDEATSNTAAAPVAYVYVQTHKGVNVYDAAANGKLTPVKGSPFKISGQMEDISGKYLVSVGTINLHVYAIESNGTVGKQVSVINTQSYSGSECGTNSAGGSVLDRTGKYLYVQLYGLSATSCVAWQSYQLKSNGDLVFLGSMEYESTFYGDPIPSTVPTISSNNEFAYGDWYGPEWASFSTFVREPNGALNALTGFTEVDPVTDPSLGDAVYMPFLEGAPSYLTPQADTSGHLAALMFYVVQPINTGFGPIQIASYTINPANGDISSTNTYTNMPIPAITLPTIMTMSPSGRLLALGGMVWEDGGGGIQIFHFNGAAPVTVFSSELLPDVTIDQLSWDKDNHLYALSYASGLYVYTVTPTSITKVAGSPFSVAGAYGLKGLIVVPKP